MHGTMIEPGTWDNVRAIVDRKLGRLGIANKHRGAFYRDSRTWTKGMLEAWWQGDAARMVQGPGAQVLDVLPPSTLAMPDFTAFQNELKNYNEVVRWPLYSYKAYATAGQNQLTFFDQTEGTATLGRADTNMQAPNQLPGNQMHVAHALRIFTFPAAADVTAAGVVGGNAAFEWYRLLVTGSWLEAIISDKIYMIGAPLTLFPAGAGIGTFVNNPGIATANNFAHVNNGHPSNEALFRLDPPLGILPTRTFSVTLNWRALQPITAAGRIGPVLDGWRLRSVQ